MKLRILKLPFIFFIVLPMACQKESDGDKLAPLFENLGNYHRKVSTNSKTAQRYFDQGLTLVYGFNHPEAIRSFREAARLDPYCPMFYWGIALAMGPNINRLMDNKSASDAFFAVQKAKQLVSNSTERERALVVALSKRYAIGPKADRQALDVAYAKAMFELTQRYPQDPDIATLFAESLMLLNPWDYWKKDGSPKPNTLKIIETLETVMDTNPNHPGANHYYIHTVEATQPERAVTSAKRLENLVPGAGHLSHMPAHIYLLLGRYKEASEATARGAKADEAYMEQCERQGFPPADYGASNSGCGSGYYAQTYYSHNIHFLWYTASMEGRSKVAIDAAHKFISVVDENWFLKYPALEEFLLLPLFAYARFGKWDEILKTPKPAEHFQYATGMWHYARGLAYASTDQVEKAIEESAELKTLAESNKMKNLTLYTGATAATVLQLAQDVLSANIARAQGDSDLILKHFSEAIEKQDELPFAEPPVFYISVRQVFGAALLEIGNYKKAERMFTEDLEKFPRNGWSLFGLGKSLREQGRLEEAEKIQQQFEEVWSEAAITLSLNIM